MFVSPWRASIAREQRELAATHYCNGCGAKWRKWDDGNWSLISHWTRPCCDNAPMDKQMIPLPKPRPQGEA